MHFSNYRKCFIEHCSRNRRVHERIRNVWESDFPAQLGNMYRPIEKKENRLFRYQRVVTSWPDAETLIEHLN